MPSTARPLRSRVAGVAVLGAFFALAACGSSTVRVPGFTVTSAGRQACPRIMAHLPAHVAGQHRRTTTGSRFATAYGDPAIIVRCGVERPHDYLNAPCLTRNGIGWSTPLRQSEGGGNEVDMTLVHRSVALKVSMPASYRPNGPADAMADLDHVVRTFTKARGRCK